MRNPNLIRVQTDRRLKPWQGLGQTRAPVGGWLKLIRNALGMSARQLGDRLSITPQGVIDMERREVEHTVSLAALSRAADAMDCELVYAIVPRTSLSKHVLRQAHTAATEEINRIAHSMRLENQGAGRQEIDRLIAEREQQLLAQEGKIWDAAPSAKPKRRGRRGGG